MLHDSCFEKKKKVRKHGSKNGTKDRQTVHARSWDLNTQQKSYINQLGMCKEWKGYQ